MARAAGWRVRIVPRLSVADGIDATPDMFPTMWFDRAKRADGLLSPRHHRCDTDDAGRFSKNPLHDHASHGSNALRYVTTATNGDKRRLYGGGKRTNPRWKPGCGALARPG